MMVMGLGHDGLTPLYRLFNGLYLSFLERVVYQIDTASKRITNTNVPIFSNVRCIVIPSLHLP
jgi:hypothetical protein